MAICAWSLALLAAPLMAQGQAIGWQQAPGHNRHLRAIHYAALRPFGVLTGDKVRQHITLSVDTPFRLQRSSLPPTHWVNDWLELQAIQVHKAATDGDTRRYAVTLDYQIFRMPRAVSRATIPGVVLRFAGQGGGQGSGFRVTTADWVFAMSPLLKPEAGQGPEDVLTIPLRADAAPLPIDTRALAYRLALFSGSGLVLGLALLYLSPWWPLGRRARGPFSRALRELRTVRRSDDRRMLRRGYRRVHQALNETAGQALFAERLEHFLAERPAFQPLRERLQRFFAQSRQLFFATDDDQTATHEHWAWLEALCRQCRAVERGR